VRLIMALLRRMYGEGFDELLARMDASGTPGFYVTDIVGSVRQESILRRIRLTKSIEIFNGGGNVTRQDKNLPQSGPIRTISAHMAKCHSIVAKTVR